MKEGVIAITPMSTVALPCLALPYESLHSASRNSIQLELPGCAITMAGRLPTQQGYSALAELFGGYPSLGVFHLFKDLNAANLLDLQAELLLLKRDLEVFMHAETALSRCTESDPLTASVQHLKKSNRQSCPYHERIWHTKLEIRQKLKEYSMSSDRFEVPNVTSPC